MAVAFLLYVFAEIAAIWAVGSAVGVLGTLGLLLAGAFIGSWLARREGAKAMRAFIETSRAGRSAEKELTDGMLVGLGGVLILIPGFVSDVLGLLLMLPPSRAVARRLWLKRMEKRALKFANQRRGPVMVVDSEVVPPSSSSSEEKPHPVIEGRVIEG
ncbi:FxsA family protein [Amycolatopsis sp. NBC_00348]|uniref:FxsA family protein n=1 Tax=unclassified Amycolatopsis TaxID=2618356 RepID=UPI002E152D0F|nr:MULTISPECIES: FxsA family protein [unclassified Amycolatopsis]WSJ75115.1 FxsA family protein [Amycolatopsis sp. NBC_01307]